MLSDSEDDLLGPVHASPASPDLDGVGALLASSQSESELRFGASDRASASGAELLLGLESSLDELGLHSTPTRDASSPDLLSMDVDGVDEDLFATPVAWRSPATSPNASFVGLATKPRQTDDDLLGFDDDDGQDADDEDLLELGGDDHPPSDDDPLDFDER